MRYFLRKIGFFVAHPVGRGDPELPHPAAAARRPRRADGAAGSRARTASSTLPRSRRCASMLGAPDGSLWTQYWAYLADLLRGDFGVSYTYYPFSVTEVIGQAIWWTVGARRRHAGHLLRRRHRARGVRRVAAQHQARHGRSRSARRSSARCQPFWIALVLLYVFGYTLGWFPTSGGYSASTPGFNAFFIEEVLSHSSLPALALLIVDADRLDPRHAQHDDHEPGRGLHPARQGQGPARPHRRPPVRRPQRVAAQRHRLRARPRQRARRHDPRGDRLRLPRPGPADG